MEYLTWHNRVNEGDFESSAISAKGKQVVIIALGFAGGERSGLTHELGVAFDERGRMIRDSEYRAQIKPLFPGFKPKVYVAGEADLMGETNLPIAVTPRTKPLAV
ncbi:hypothetical protein NQ023_00340 [Corynebacterium phoceense]|uniref:hypothetical protein n=1 Tax=Corynebacterium phoceense TaxID=1686286 RepID=UPI00211B7CAA|nr:hypothetical protein [Corynebacterium phoceense]MCQ9330524.1 hypothetical protein [Corynebacterium phoceense]MCQ9346920.1 hypothetical protein [Corynebacterium phoceense]